MVGSEAVRHRRRSPAWFAKVAAVLKGALALRNRRDEGAISNRGLGIAKGKIKAKMDSPSRRA